MRDFGKTSKGFEAAITKMSPTFMDTTLTRTTRWSRMTPMWRDDADVHLHDHACWEWRDFGFAMTVSMVSSTTAAMPRFAKMSPKQS